MIFDPMKSAFTAFTAAIVACAIAQEPAAPAPTPAAPSPAPPAAQEEKPPAALPAPGAPDGQKEVVVTEREGKQQMLFLAPHEIEALARSLFPGEKMPVRTGPVTYLGVAAVEVPKEVAAQLAIPQDTGLLVAGVAPDSPAAQAGLAENDVLTKLDDQIVVTPRQLAVLIANHRKGDAVKITYYRKGQPGEISAVLGERIAPPPADTANPLARITRFSIRFGQDGKIIEQPQEEDLKALPEEVRKHIESVIKQHAAAAPQPARTEPEAKPNP
jgi:PDZ domain